MGRLRIIAGTLRGRRLEVPAGGGVRPTPERVREALFDILGPGGPGGRVLDAYAGSGALGLEALSRGARTAVFVERDPAVARILRRNIETLGLADGCEIIEASVLRAVRQTLARDVFDLILADPPYGSGESGRFLPHAIQRLAPDGLLVLERDRHDSAASDPVPPDRTVRYGSTCLDFYRLPEEGGVAGGAPG